MRDKCSPLPVASLEWRKIALERHRGCNNGVLKGDKELKITRIAEDTCRRVWSFLWLHFLPCHPSKLPMERSSLRDTLTHKPGELDVKLTITNDKPTWGVGQPERRVAGLRHSVRSKMRRNRLEESSPWPHTPPWWNRIEEEDAHVSGWKTVVSLNIWVD